MFALRFLTVLTAFCVISAVPLRSHAAELPGAAGLFAALTLPEGSVEFSNGFDATGNAWSAYASAVIAVSGRLDHDGWRVKLSGLYGSYAYDTRATYCQLSAEEKKQLTGTNFSDLCNDIANAPPQGAERDHVTEIISPYGLRLEGDQIVAITPHQATRYQLGAAPGYQATFGLLIVKAYLGVAYEQQTVMPADPTKVIQGGYWGAQGAIEAWLPLGDSAWLSADGSYFTGTSSYSAAMKLGYRAMPWLTVGPELASYGDEDDVSGRAGGFLRFDISGMETTLAGGISGTYKGDPDAFGSANIFVRF